jgi:DNA-binding PadR family transcriptional regulator
MRPGYPKTIYTLLNMLNTQPMSGYEIKQKLKHTIKHFWSESDGQIYPGLKRCVDEGLAESAELSNSAGNLLKKTYAITDEGKAALQDWRENMCHKQTQRDEGLLKLTFCDADQTHIVKRILKERIEDAYKTLQTLDFPHNHASDHTRNLPYWAMIEAHRRSLLNAEIAWAKTALEKLDIAAHQSATTELAEAAA